MRTDSAVVQGTGKASGTQVSTIRQCHPAVGQAVGIWAIVILANPEVRGWYEPIPETTVDGISNR
jgi:hypothetical protein